MSSQDVQEGSTDPHGPCSRERGRPHEQVIEIPDFLHRC
ncbi:hypothetical protein M768_12085 [Cellulosimicrobium cellulans F16]|uniref:Uncharacterized protein n=1 Tax=Cellulosimicrobium cellulans F16 TaxID=1350482 RepID=A0A0M0F903_CELCE|nr:hypothetical protein M768_12085 [Cellulosimicrobium cellulans F16]